MSNRSTGAAGEGIAAACLKEKGMQILETNYRCTCGEVDIIARDGEWLVFAEVKTRRGVAKGLPSEAVNADKRRHIVRTALQYLQSRGLLESRVRFDVVEVLPWGVRHIPGAFDATGII